MISTGLIHIDNWEEKKSFANNQINRLEYSRLIWTLADTELQETQTGCHTVPDCDTQLRGLKRQRRRDSAIMVNIGIRQFVNHSRCFTDPTMH